MDDDFLKDFLEALREKYGRYMTGEQARELEFKFHEAIENTIDEFLTKKCRSLNDAQKQDLRLEILASLSDYHRDVRKLIERGESEEPKSN